MGEDRRNLERNEADTAQGLPGGDRHGTPGLPAHPGVSTGGTIAGDDATGSMRNEPGGNLNPAHRMVNGWDSIGEEVPEDPALAGTIAGNTTAAGGIDYQAGEGVDDEEDDPLGLGPEGTTVQEIGGAAREG